MKVRVIKEMPLAKVGNVFNTEKGKWTIICNDDIEDLIRMGWLEEVKEQELDNKIFCKYANDTITHFTARDIAKIAKEHILAAVDKATKGLIVKSTYQAHEIRKAIEES